ncbi:hypothetical protein BDE40_1620 [Litoreibacter halocynthiae]|uniref:DUF6314 domain-containing protein n=1 Tax=Litoreibacter halocynthiae TaxID=1242689 RepID=A0A4R7LKI6_9RHOB|nr:DUF6314 family protein [Litoreibacter halocynthiae]TDT74901.1 hypothetical protein BDE40_1620 [Litoreibacter halocynthiae]
MHISLDQFEGDWQLARIIEDRRNDIEGRLSGTANFTRVGPLELLYAEEGELVYGQQAAMLATRRYIWRGFEGEHAGKIAVEFEDGRPFHLIELDRLMPDDDHHCDPDFYHVSYDFSRWPQWESIWRVVGPSKDYRMISRFQRV